MRFRAVLCTVFLFLSLMKVKLSLFVENTLLIVCRNQNNSVSLYQQLKQTAL